MKRDSNGGLAEALRRSQEYFLRTQHADGYWSGELETNVCMAAEYLLLTHFLGARDDARWRKIARYLRRRQRPDGGFLRAVGDVIDRRRTPQRVQPHR